MDFTMRKQIKSILKAMKMMKWTSSAGGPKSPKNSSKSCSTIGERRWKKKRQQHQRATSLKPFKLRTEERGRQKVEEFMKKIQ